ncbi:hypothetical protein C0J52_27976 [Blattella germanica]|nr:hypothetical protein C0J52_27976 [Blattella germanica]
MSLDIDSAVKFLISAKFPRQTGHFSMLCLQSLQILCPFKHCFIGGVMYWRQIGHSI